MNSTRSRSAIGLQLSEARCESSENAEYSLNHPCAWNTSTWQSATSSVD